MRKYYMGQNMGQLISKLRGNLRDIDIKNLTLSLIKQTGCIGNILVKVTTEKIIADTYNCRDCDST